MALRKSLLALLFGVVVFWISYEMNFKYTSSSLTQLEEWRYELRAYLGEGITSLSVDEENKKLNIGYDDNYSMENGQQAPKILSDVESKERMVKILREMGIPDSAYNLFPAQPAVAN